MTKQVFNIQNEAGVAKIKIIGSISRWENNYERFTEMVDQLLESGITDVDAYLNCFGGSVIHANEIINQINRFPGKKSCTVGAVCASSGFTILISCFDQENTWGHMNTQGMYHNLSASLEVNSEDDFDSNKQLYINLKSDVVKRLAERMNLSEEVVMENMRKTTWLNADALIKNGVIGKNNIIDKKDKVPTGTKNSLQNSGIDLPDFMNQVEESELEDILNANQNPNNKDTEMKELAKKLGLPENATPDQINAAIEVLQNKAKVGEEVLVNLGVSKGFKEETLKKSIANNFEATMELINSIEAPATPAGDAGEGEGKTEVNGKTEATVTQPSNALKELLKEMKNEAGSGSKKTIDDYTPEELDKMERETPEKFEQLFNESKFGKVRNPTD